MSKQMQGDPRFKVDRAVMEKKYKINDGSSKHVETATLLEPANNSASNQNEAEELRERDGEQRRHSAQARPRVLGHPRGLPASCEVSSRPQLAFEPRPLKLNGGDRLLELAEREV